MDFRARPTALYARIFVANDPGLPDERAEPRVLSVWERSVSLDVHDAWWTHCDSAEGTAAEPPVGRRGRDVGPDARPGDARAGVPRLQIRQRLGVERWLQLTRCSIVGGGSGPGRAYCLGSSHWTRSTHTPWLGSLVSR